MLNKGVALMLPENGLDEKLKQAESENRKLNIKLGFDPTAPDLHLGHAVILNKLKEFQDLGHNIFVIIGSFTAKIGDPTGKNVSRKALEQDVVLKNALTYIDQLSKILDISKVEICYNDLWLNDLNLSDIIKLMSKVTVAQLLQRNDFNKRYNEEVPIHLNELMYPILQGYDSLKIDADIELGGTDQMFNCSIGRHLQELEGKSPQVIMLMPILRGLDGKEKMSKSLNNYVGLTDEPNDMFGKIMSIPDDLIEEYFNLATNYNEIEIETYLKDMVIGVNPMAIKKSLARKIVSMYYDYDTATEAFDFFTTQYQSKNKDEKVFEKIVSDIKLDTEVTLIDLCHSIKSDLSKTAIKKLITSGAVEINNVKINNPLEIFTVSIGLKIKIGKRNYYELYESL